MKVKVSTLAEVDREIASGSLRRCTCGRAYSCPLTCPFHEIPPPATLDDVLARLAAIEAKLDGLRRFVFATAPRKAKKGKK